MAAQEKGSQSQAIKVTFSPMKRGGKFRAQIHCKGESYMIVGKEGLLSKTRLNSFENMILAELREKIVPIKNVTKKISSYSPPFRFGYGYGYGY
ncbi:MAG: hypothetical protein WCG98_03100 [bacterium]